MEDVLTDYPMPMSSQDLFLEDHTPAPMGSYPGEQIEDPHQRGLWAPNPGPSYRNAFQSPRTVHLTLKLNVPEALIYSDTGAARLELDLQACRLIRQAAADLRAAVAAPPPVVAAYVPPPSSGAAADTGECLSCQ